MIRTAQDVLDAAKARGFEVKIKPGPPPMPYLVGKFANATPALMEALKAFRVEILELLIGDPVEEGMEDTSLAHIDPDDLKDDPADTVPLPMEDDELPDDVPEGVSTLIRASDGTIKAYQQPKEQS